MNGCMTIGKDRDSKERLGIGFGNNQGQGIRKGTGFRKNISRDN